jgi:hypothetical protein
VCLTLVDLREKVVGLTVYQALDKAIEAGGSNLTGKDIVGAARGATGLLDEMCTSGLLEKTSGRSPKYTVTANGRETWERQVPEDRRHQIQQIEQQQRQQQLLGFLKLIEKKHGRPLTKTELPRFPAPVRDEACDRHLIEKGEKANSYRLLESGEQMLLAEQPFEEQLERLRQLSRQVVAQWHATQQRMHRELTGAAIGPLEQATSRLAERGQKACEAFDNAVAEMAGLVGVREAAQQVRAEVETAARQARETVEAERARLADLEAGLQQEAQQQRDLLASFERQLEERFADLERRLKASGEVANPAPLEPAPPLQSEPSEVAVWDATRLAYERLRRQSLAVGGIVKVPELTDAVTRSLDDLSSVVFHDLLKKWQQEDRLTLQLCNDPRLEPRSSEGIQSPRGLLFYVQMR